MTLMMTQVIIAFSGPTEDLQFIPATCPCPALQLHCNAFSRALHSVIFIKVYISGCAVQLHYIMQFAPKSAYHAVKLRCMSA